MRVTKKMRKKAEGMNAITQQHYNDGSQPPIYSGGNWTVNPSGKDVAPHSKIGKGTPYVNINNFVEGI
jgi:hypothetical protein